MGVTMLLNARIVERVGMRRLAHVALVGHVVAAGGVAAVAVTWGGRPPIALFVVELCVMLAGHALLLPNLNTIAMDPMASVAGTAP